MLAPELVGTPIDESPATGSPAPEALPFLTRLWFAWLCLFQVLFNPRFAAHVWSLRHGAQLGPSPEAPVLEAAVRAAPVSEPRAPVPALQLLALLQREGRLIDFLKQDIEAFSDADVGAAARVVHEGCRKALDSHAHIDPIRNEAEGQPLELPGGMTRARSS